MIKSLNRLWIPVLAASALVLSACAGASGESSGTADSNDPEALGADGEATAPTVDDPSPFTLTAGSSGVLHVGADEVERSLDRGEMVPFQRDDRAEVGDKGLGLLDLAAIDIELFLSGKAVLSGAQMNGERLAQVNVELVSGHLRVVIDESSDTTVVIQAGGRRLTTMRPGTDATICQGGNGATCVRVAHGLVEWFGQGERVEVTDSKGTFAGPDQPPEPPMCTNEAAFEDWLEKAKQGEAELTLAQHVEEWAEDECAPEGLGSYAGNELPSDEDMTHVIADAPTIGTDESGVDTEHYLTPSTSPTNPVDLYVNDVPVSNEQYRAWLVWEARDDADKWRELAPASWLANATADAATQATYPDGEGDTPVTGVSHAAAERYCPFEFKRLITEIEWEVAAVNGDVETGSIQEWVADSSSYAPVPDGSVGVLRGADDLLEPDLYFRLPVTDDVDGPVARLYAGIRCAADEVRSVARVGDGGDALYADDFVGFDNAWPLDTGEFFDLGYHPSDYYHVESSEEHAQILVVDRVDDIGEISEWVLRSNVFIRNTSEDDGNFRYGLAAGSATDSGFVAFTVQPEQVEGQWYQNWCVEWIEGDDPLTFALTDPEVRYSARLLPEGGVNRHRGEAPCTSGLDNGREEVEDAENTLAMTVRGSSISVSIDDREVGAIDQAVALDQIGFFVETFHKDKAHIHYNTLELDSP